MERVTQNTAASAEESASASEELTAQSEALKAIVQRLTAMVGAGKATTAQTGPVQRGNGGSRRAGPDPLTAARTAPANP
jgi:methyl-accepting chemotaxis protein